MLQSQRAPAFTCGLIHAVGELVMRAGMKQVVALGVKAQSALVTTLIAGEYGTSPDKVPSIAEVLGAPALRGSEVTVK